MFEAIWKKYKQTYSLRILQCKVYSSCRLLVLIKSHFQFNKPFGLVRIFVVRTKYHRDLDDGRQWRGWRSRSRGTEDLRIGVKRVRHGSCHEMAVFYRSGGSRRHDTPSSAPSPRYTSRLRQTTAKRFPKYFNIVRLAVVPSGQLQARVSLPDCCGNKIPSIHVHRKYVRT